MNTHCDQCGEQLREVLIGGDQTGKTICATCDPPLGTCPLCGGKLRSENAKQCPNCLASWRGPVTDQNQLEAAPTEKLAKPSSKNKSHKIDEGKLLSGLALVGVSIWELSTSYLTDNFLVPYQSNQVLKNIFSSGVFPLLMLPWGLKLIYDALKQYVSGWFEALGKRKPGTTGKFVSVFFEGLGNPEILGEYMLERFKALGKPDSSVSPEPSVSQEQATYAFGDDEYQELMDRTYKAWISGKCLINPDYWKKWTQENGRDGFEKLIKPHKVGIQYGFSHLSPEDNEYIVAVQALDLDNTVILLTNKYLYFLNAGPDSSAINQGDGKIALEDINGFDKIKGFIRLQVEVHYGSGKSIILHKCDSEMFETLSRIGEPRPMNTGNTGDKFDGVCNWSGTPLVGYKLGHDVWLASRLRRRDIIGYICPWCNVVSDSHSDESGIVFSRWSAYEKSICQKCKEKVPRPNYLISEAGFEERYALGDEQKDDSSEAIQTNIKQSGKKKSELISLTTAILVATTMLIIYNTTYLPLKLDELNSITFEYSSISRKGKSAEAGMIILSNNSISYELSSRLWMKKYRTRKLLKILRSESKVKIWTTNESGGSVYGLRINDIFLDPKDEIPRYNANRKWFLYLLIFIYIFSIPLLVKSIRTKSW